MSEDVLETIHIRNDFYRDGYRKCLFIVLILIVSNLLMLSALFVQFNKKRKYIFSQHHQMVASFLSSHCRSQVYLTQNFWTG